MYLALGKNETVPKTFGHELFSTHTLPCPNQSNLFRHHDSHNNLCCHLQLLEAKLRITCVCTSRAETPLSSLHFSPSNTPHNKTSIHNQGSGQTHVTGQKSEAPAEKHFSPAENTAPRGAVLQTRFHSRLAGNEASEKLYHILRKTGFRFHLFQDQRNCAFPFAMLPPADKPGSTCLHR